MIEKLPNSVVWLRRIILLQLIIGVTYILFLIYLAFAQPINGWRSGVQLGFLEGLKDSSNHQDVVFFTAEEAGYSATPFIVSVLLDFAMLRMVKNRSLGMLKGTILFKLIYSVISRSIPFLEIIMLVLIFNKNTRAFFKEKSENKAS